MQRTALQFSGGKDSIALLLLLKDRLNEVTVYFLDTGDTNPETLSIVDWAESLSPNFVRIQSDVWTTWKYFGIPSDAVPYSSSDSAAALGQRETLLMQDRYNCCFRTVMEPMHQRMLDDGITTIIRGQKNVDHYKGPYKSGHIEECSGITYEYPIEDWTDAEVFAYIEENSGPLPNFYKECYTHVGDCLQCTAWMDGRRGAYLKKYHPAAFQEYRLKVTRIRDALAPSVTALMKDLEGMT